MRIRRIIQGVAAGLGALVTVAPNILVEAQAPVPTLQVKAVEQAQSSPSAAASAGDYRIGPEDILSIFFWREDKMSGDVIVRPDGKISVPLVNDVQAVGLTPEELRVALTKAAASVLEAPTVTVTVKQINSRKVWITGEINKMGNFPLTGPMNVLQLIAAAGGLKEYADSKNIAILRYENGGLVTYRFNYNEVMKRKNLKQNIELMPGDTIVVP